MIPDKLKRDVSHVLLFPFLFCMTCLAWSQETANELPRRGATGIAISVDDTGIVKVIEVLAGSAAKAAGIRVDDEFVAIDGLPVHSVAEVQAAVGKKRAGDVLSVEMKRDGKPLQLPVTLHAFPYESMPGSTLDYGQLTITGGIRLRTIFSMPDNSNRPVPAVLLVQGGGCGSIDNPWTTRYGMTALIHAIGAEGYATMRVDKPGTGDSEGLPCAEISYFDELDGYRGALKKLRAMPDVDPERVFLLGISLGGFFAPFLALDPGVAGIAMYGMLASGPNRYPGRSERFFDEIATQDVQVAWSQIDKPVLAILGEYDGRKEFNDHERIARIVNASHPDMAKSLLLPGHDHCWTHHASLEASIDQCGRGETTTVLQDTVINFLKTNSRVANQEN